MSTELDEVNSDSSTLGIRLREEVQRIGGVTKADEVVKSSRATIYNWFESGLIPATELQALAGIGVDVLYVVTGQRNIIDAQNDALGAAARTLGNLNEALEAGDLFPKIRVSWMNKQFKVDPNDYRWVPVLNVKVSGGMGLEALSEHVVAFNGYRKDWLEKKGLLEAVLSEVTVEGPSMEPVLRDGETVLVNHSANEIRGGDIYVIRINDDLVVKYLQQIPGDRLQVSSENSTAFRPYEISMDELGNGVDIIGRVVPRGLNG